MVFSGEKGKLLLLHDCLIHRHLKANYQLKKEKEKKSGGFCKSPHLSTKKIVNDCVIGSVLKFFVVFFFFLLLLHSTSVQIYTFRSTHFFIG